MCFQGRAGTTLETLIGRLSVFNKAPGPLGNTYEQKLSLIVSGAPVGA